MTSVRTILKDCLFHVAGEIGTRPIGSPGNRQTREYLLRSLSDLGTPISLQHVAKTYSYSSASRLTLLEPANRVIDSWPAFGSKGAVTLSARVVDCGHGAPEEIPPEARGNIGLVKRGVIHEEVKLDNLSSAGAVAALLFVEYENALYSARVSKSVSVMPAAIIREQDARSLLSSDSTLGALVSLNVEASSIVADCANIIVDCAKEPRAHTVVCAHYDSRPSTPGANDNAAGVACVFALIHLALAIRTRMNVRFVFFDGEELGLVGSKAYAESEWMRGCERVINIDGLGANRLSVLTKDPQGSLDSHMIQSALRGAAELGISLKTAESRTGLSDHNPLRAKGARTLWFSDHPNPGRETDVDVPEAVDIAELQNVTALSKLLAVG